MSKFKKVLLLCTTYALVAALAIGGTIAYLQDDDSDVNVMTLGNVSIAQHEYERALNEDGTYKTDTIDNRTSYVLQDFTQAKPLYPAIIPNNGSVGGVSWDYDDIPVRMSQVDSYGGASVFNTPNALDKFVTVENTGKTDAYVRTLIAMEVGTAEIYSDEYPNEPLISSEIRAAKADKNTNGEKPWTYGYTGYITVDGNKYMVYELIYTGAMTSSGWKHENGVLPAGDTTYPSLCQIYLASRATNEDVEALDGNNNGTYDVIVLSQAVQAAGFADAKTALDTAFGKASENAATWFGGTAIPTTVSTAAELTTALAAGENVVLADDVEAVATAVAPYGNNVGFVQNGGVLDGAGNTLTVIEGSKTYAVMTYGGTIKNLTINSGVRGIVTYTPSEDVIIDNVVIDGPGYAINSAEQSAVNLIVSNSTVNGWTSYGGFTSASFTNCKFGTNTTKYWYNAGYAESYDRLIRPYNATTFTNCEFEEGFTLSLGYLNGAEVIFENCYCNGVKLTAENVSTYLSVTEIPSSVIFR